MSHEGLLSGIIGGRLIDSWSEQRQLINRLSCHDDAEGYICLELQEVVWAAIVYYEAFDVADWMVSRGYSATPEWDDDGETGYLCVPLDASTWPTWIQSRLMIPPSSVSDESVKKYVHGMVTNGFIKIPLKSGFPHYHWVLEGYRQDDFCELYRCIEHFGQHFHSGNYTSRQMKKCLDSYMAECVRAGTAIYMVRAVSDEYPETAQAYSGQVIAKLLENMYRTYRDKKRSVSAKKIQAVFRGYSSTKRVNIIRSHPDNLFDSFSGLRKRKLE